MRLDLQVNFGKPKKCQNFKQNLGMKELNKYQCQNIFLSSKIFPYYSGKFKKLTIFNFNNYINVSSYCFTNILDIPE